MIPAPGVRRRDAARRLTSPIAAACLLLAFYVVLLFGLREKSATFDEPGHAMAGYVYWKFGDYRFDPENGNLSKRWIALPFLFSDYRFPDTSAHGWGDSNSWRLADQWFNRLGHDADAMLFRGRAMSALVAVALGVVVWLWSRQLFGDAGGMVSLLLYVLNPTILANGGLMASDTPAALGFLLSSWCIWSTLERISVPRVLGGTLAIAALFLFKMSAILILPIALALATARILDGRPLPVGQRLLTSRAQRTWAIAGVALLQTAGVIAMVWACYGFRYSAFSPQAPAPRFHQTWQWALGLPPLNTQFDQLNLTPAQRSQVGELLRRTPGANSTWSYALLGDLEKVRQDVLTPEQGAILDRLLAAQPSNAVPRLIHLAREHRLLPEAFLYGYAHVWKTSGKLTAFLNGEIRDTGWLIYFPFTFAVKTPLGLFGVIALAIGAAWVQWRTPAEPAVSSRLKAVWPAAYRVLPLALLFIVYWTVALTANLNIGHRHLLPTYPPLFVLCGAAGAWFASGAVAKTLSPATARRARLGLATLLGLLAIETAYRFPNYIAYFNGLVTPAKAYRHLIDSSLDWGQELPAIARYLRERPDERAYLAFFGVGSPANYRVKAQPIGGHPGLDWKLWPPVKPVAFTSLDEVRAVVRQHPEYDPDLVFTLENAKVPSVLLVQRSTAHRLTGGIYIISASMLQPVFMELAGLEWDATHEREYRRLLQIVQPLLSGDRDAKIAAVHSRPVLDWLSIFDGFYEYRLARLTAFLRKREPDDQINFSVLVYRLSDAEVARALDGPLP